MSIRPLAIAVISITLSSALISAPAYIHSVFRAAEPNTPPVAVNDSYTVHGGTNIGPFLVNDYDPDGDSITAVEIDTLPAHGNLFGLPQPDRKLYGPHSGYVGPDSFTYRCKDSFNNWSSIATVNLNVVNTAPVAVNDNYNVHGGTNIGPFMFNDADPDGDSISFYDILTYPAHGTLTGLPYPTYPYDMKRYGPHSGYTGSDSFTYKICDQFNLCSAPATVTLNVTNNGPVAVADFYIARGGTIIGPFTANDYDPDGDTYSFYDLMTYPAHGNLYGLPYPNYPVDAKQYAPNAGYTGSDSFTYKICDQFNLCSTATIYILVLPGPDPAPNVSGCPTDPKACDDFSPSHNAFRGVSAGASGSAGPSGPDPVNLTTGREAYMPPPELSVYNATGPSAFWQLGYLSYQALIGATGYGSPGLARGWVHGYDVTVQGVAGSWGALKLNYPSGATETLTPQLDGSGQPTGVFTTVAGAPYIVSGVSGSPTGTWQSVTVTWKDQTKWKFTLLSGTTYVLNQLTNRTGQSLNFSWNSSRQLTQVADATTSTVLLTLAYASNGKLTTATDAYSRQITYTFSAGSSTNPGMLQSVSQVVPSGTANPPARWTYTYTADKGLQLNTATVPSPTGSGTSTATISYDSVGKVTSLVDANGNQRIYTYNANTTQIQVKDSANSVALSWAQKFDANRRDTGITDAANHSTMIAYADATNPLKPTSVTDRNSHTTTYTYDQFGNVLTATSPRNVTTTYTWSYTNFMLGRLTSVQEGTKPATTIAYYEPSGLVQSVTRPAPNGSGTTTTSYSYDSLGNVLTVTGPGNNATTQITTTLNYTTDDGYSQSAKIGQPITVTDNLSHVTHLRYDSQGRLTSVTDALGNEMNASYNLVGQTDTITFPATGQTGTGRARTVGAHLYVGGPLTTITSYDESNLQVRQVTGTYGLEGEPLSVTGSTEPVTHTYDALYRVKTLKDGNNNTTTYDYNNIGLVSLITMPGGQTTQFPSYDNDGNRLQRIDGNGVVTNYLYSDPESLLTDIQYPASTSLNVHFGYDTFRRRSSMIDGTGSHAYSYGNLDELISLTTNYTGLPAQPISYTYYPNSSRQTMITPAGTFSYNYDAGGRPSSMTNPFTETTSWTYLNNDWLQTQTLANGATATYTYNAVGQVTRLLNQLAGNTISDFSNIAYDGVGNRMSITASIPGASSLNGVTTYQYDSKNQLTQESSTRNGGFADAFGYDSAGNPTSFKGITKTYNSNNQETGTGFAYDGNGNPTSYAGTTLTFDPENRMTAYGSVLTAGYNGRGLRAWKENSTARTYSLYDGIFSIVEMDSSGTVIATNSFGANGVVSRRGSASKFYSFDSEQNVAQRSDSSGGVVSNDLYSAHGDPLSGSSIDPFGFKAWFGYYTDVETELALLTFRYYSTPSGRFVTRDPIGYRGGVNLYAYVQNRPIIAADPLGHDLFGIIGGAAGGAAVGGAGVMGSGSYLIGINDHDGERGGSYGGAGSFGIGAGEYGYPINREPSGGLGLMAGAGGGFFWSNAKDFGELKGHFSSTIIATPWGFGLAIDKSGPTWVVSLTYGRGWGAGIFHFTTNTPGCTIWESSPAPMPHEILPNL